MKTIQEYIEAKTKYQETQNNLHTLAQQIEDYGDLIAIAFAPLYIKQENCYKDKQLTNEFAHLAKKVKRARFKLNGNKLTFYSSFGYGEFPIFYVDAEFLNRLFSLYSEGKIGNAVRLSYKIREKDTDKAKSNAEKYKTIHENDFEIRELKQAAETLKTLGIEKSDPAVDAINKKIKSISDAREKLQDQIQPLDKIKVLPAFKGKQHDYLFPDGNEIVENRSRYY